MMKLPFLLIPAITLLAHSALAASGDDKASAKALQQTEQKKDDTQALEAEIARQRLILQALEAQLQSLKQEPMQPTAKPVIEITLDGSACTVDGTPTSADDFLKAILARAGDDRAFPIIIRATKETSQAQVQAVLQACANSGFHKIGVVSSPAIEYDKAGTPIRAPGLPAGMSISNPHTGQTWTVQPDHTLTAQPTPTPPQK